MPISYLHRHDLHSLRAAARVLGYRSAITLWVGESFTNKIAKPLQLRHPHPIQAVNIKGYKHPVYIRLGSSDARVVDQIFVQREYSAFDDLDPKPRMMIDCGGNIGCSSIYFLDRYPDLRVVLVEPEEENLKLCRRNLEPYAERVEIIQAGVWSSPTGLVLSGQGWATKVRKAEPSEMPVVYATDIPSLLSLTPDDHVDLLKIDIERSEVDVFREGATAWLSRVRNIAIELHDSECEKVFYKALSDYNYDTLGFGELTFCKNIRPL